MALHKMEDREGGGEMPNRQALVKGGLPAELGDEQEKGHSRVLEADRCDGIGLTRRATGRDGRFAGCDGVCDPGAVARALQEPRRAANQHCRPSSTRRGRCGWG